MYLINRRTVALVVLLCFQSSLKCVEAKCTPSKKPFALTLENCTLPGTNVDSWGIRSIEIGGTTTCLVPSMFVDNVLLMDTALCDEENLNAKENETTRAQCESRRGGPVNIAALGSAFIRGAESDLAVDQNWINLMGTEDITSNVYGTPGKVELNLPDDMRLSQFSVGVVNQGQYHSAAHLGLGPKSTFLTALGASGMNPAFGFGLDVGSQSVAAPRTGNLVIDGYDAASVRGVWHNYSINHNPPDQGTRICPLQVTVDEMTVKFPNGTLSDNLLGTGSTRSNGAACIEPYDNYFRFLTQDFERFADVINWRDRGLRSQSLYIMEPGLLFDSTRAFEGSLVITLNDGFVIEVPAAEMSRPLRGIDTTGKQVLQNNLTEIAVYNSANVLSKMTLGKAFLSQVYLQVDYKADKFRLASVNTAPASTNLVSFGSNSTIECDEPGGGSMDAKAIGFTVAFSILGAVLLGIIIFWFWRRRRRTRMEPVGIDRQRLDDPEWDNRRATIRQVETPLQPFVTNNSGTSELSGQRRRSELEGR